jgi:hypothetical protein
LAEEHMRQVQWRLQLVELDWSGQDGEVKKVQAGGGLAWTLELRYLQAFYQFFLVDCQVFHDFQIFFQGFYHLLDWFFVVDQNG